MSKVTMVASGTIRDEEKIKKYQLAAIPVLKKHGAILPPLSREVTTILAGERKPKFLLEVDFPTEQNILDAFNDEDYQAVIKLRDEGFEDLSIFIAK